MNANPRIAYYTQKYRRQQADSAIVAAAEAVIERRRAQDFEAGRQACLSTHTASDQGPLNPPTMTHEAEIRPVAPRNPEKG